MIEVRQLSKYFGNRSALRKINLNVDTNRCLVTFGPNGAGKTTLLKIISTLMRPSEGEVLVGGHRVSENPGRIRQSIGFVTHSTFLYGGLTGYENLKLYAKLYGIKQIDQRINNLLEQIGLTDRLHDFVQNYSRGMKQRLSIARALVHDPPYLLLDEPFTGLDEGISEQFNLILEKLKGKGKTIILTTHNLSRGYFIADEVAILNSGNLVFRTEKKRTNIQRIKEFFSTDVEEEYASESYQYN